MQNGCYRIFQNINIFKNRLIINHSEKKTSNITIPVVNELIASDICNTDVDVLTSDSFFNKDEVISDNMEQNLVDINDLKKQLEHETAKLASSFHNELSMNRTHVQKPLLILLVCLSTK